MSTFGNPLFTSVQRPQKEDRWGSFVVSYIVQATAVMALVFYTVTAPTIMSKPVERVELIAPELNDIPKLSHVKAKVPSAARVAPRQIAMVASKAIPKIVVPVLQVQQPQRMHRVADVPDVVRPQLSVVAPKFDSKLLNALPGPKATRIIATNTFGGSSAALTLQKTAPSKVQTGGFGDPNGVAVNAHGSNRPNTAAGGAFDLPPGSGHGNGTGGTAGVRGTVASAGFGNSAAIQGGGGRGGSAAQGRIQSTSFATAAPAAPDEAHRKTAASHQAISAPVSIQSKPTPAYTPEARQLRVEGEVLLNVVFTAEGRIRILKVVRGLGHGLDESAQRAAQGVRFSPAMRDGRPIDSTVTLHIVFQLS